METTMMIKNEFGKKIGGSKRDQWKLRGLILEDLDDMNDAELVRDVKKNNIFPTPDYQALKAEGINPTVLYFRKLVKDSLSAAPTHKNRECAENYVKGVSLMKEKLTEITEWEQCKDFTQEILIKYGYLKRQDSRTLLMTEMGSACDIRKVWKKVNGTSEIQISREIKNKQFLYSDFEKFLVPFQFTAKEGSEYKPYKENMFYLKRHWSSSLVIGLSEEDFNKIPEDEEILLNQHHFIASGTHEELMNMIKALYDASGSIANSDSNNNKKEESGRKKKFVPENIAVCKRSLNDQNIYSKNVTTENMLNAYHFYGGEFGTWENNDTRQESLDLAYDAFHDLAIALGINPKEVAFENRLSIAFGARGRGGASAHYEPEREVINLTKMSGAGTLAHEYGHALDDICSKKLGNKTCFTNSARTLESSYNLMDTMFHKKETVTLTKKQVLEETKTRAEKYLDYLIRTEFRKADENGRKEVKEYVLNNMLLDSEEELYKTYKLAGEKEEPVVVRKVVETVFTKLTAMKKAYIKNARTLTNDFRTQFMWQVAYNYISVLIGPDEWSKETTMETEYYKASKEFDKAFSKQGGYWSSPEEMFARAFSCYIEDKLAEKGIKDDYLCCKSDVFSMPGENGKIYAYPRGEERKAINKCFDVFIADLKERGVL